MIKLKLNGKNIIFGLIAFVVLWYFYFSTSFVLRPFPQLFWIAMAAVSVICWFIFNKPVLKVDLAFLCGMVVLLMISLFSLNAAGSMQTVSNFVIYYLVARMLASFCSSRTILRMILLFSLVHLVCIFVQVFLPDVYISTILPLLPAQYQSNIVAQMEYNEAFYGFTTQSSVVAIYLSVGAVFSGVKLFCVKDKKTKVLFSILLVLFLIGVFFSVRRGSVVVVLLLLALMFLTSNYSNASKILLVMGAVALLLLVGLDRIPGLSGVLEKFERQAEKGSVMNGRETLFANAFQLFLQKPLFGHGIGQGVHVLGYSWLENSYLLMLMETGAVGAVAFFLPHIMILCNTLKKYKGENKRNMTVRFSVYLQLLFILMSLVENYLAAPLTVFLYFVVVMLDKETDETKKESDLRRGGL